VATGHHRGLLRQLDSLLAVGTAAELTDGQLLERFATREGASAEQAFSALVERHGPMVLRVCRGVLADSHDTEDAFQATFLVLVKKARALWVDDSLGPWLHQVALRTASCARSAAARRRKHERAAASQDRENHTVTHDELGKIQALHEEINWLPDRYRVPLILCDLEGRTHEQAARHLGWPVGSVKSRLSRARECLRDRLTRKGLAPSTRVIAAALRPVVLEDLLPRALVSSTTINAMRFAASRTILGGSAAVLAQGVLTAMSMTRWGKVASLLLVAGATVSGAGLLARGGAPGGELRVQKAAGGGPVSQMPVAEVNSGKFNISASGPGSLEQERSNDVISQVEGQTQIVSILPDGAKVKKGELVAELDTASFREQLTNQKIATRSAEAAYQNAKLTLEVAEIAVKEYEEGIYLQDRATILGEIKLAETDKQKVEARLERTRRAGQKLTETLKRSGATITSSDILAELYIEDQLEASLRELLRGTFSLEVAQNKLRVLDNYTKEKTLRELRSEVEKARAAVLAREQTWELEKTKLNRLERQIQNCKLYAPVDGLLVRGDNCEEGSTVPEHHRLFWVFEPTGHITVNIKVPESMVDRVTPGQKARIEVYAFPGQKLEGVVAKVAGLPDRIVFPHNAASPKVYSTLIKVDQSYGNFRPGMTARAEILISERDHVLSAPRKAVITSDRSGGERVAVKQPDGKFEWREVVTGDASESLVEIKQGLKPGEKIAIHPLELLSDQEKQRLKSQPPTPPAAPKQ